MTEEIVTPDQDVTVDPPEAGAEGTTVTVAGGDAPAVTVATPEATVVVTPAHTQQTTLHLLEFYPAHEPRETDPHYHLFNQTRARLEKLGKLVCWVCGKDGAAAGHPIELHHNRVEFALANGVDLTKFEAAYPEFGLVNATEDQFLDWIESEGNMLPLCKLHHTGSQGIHCIPMPIWQALKYWRDDLPTPGELSAGTV